MDYHKIQWHPAFDAALQIELAEDADCLTFEPEHLLSKKPLQVDILVIKKDPGRKIRKQLGHIFLGHNIIEYKSPDDHLSINDFYKTYAYSCLYQSEAEKTRKINPEDISVTFVCNHYPREMLKHINQFRGITVKKYIDGIYHLIGDSFPMQLIITHELPPEEYFWLQHLRNDLKAGFEIESIAVHYEPNKQSELHQAVMNVLIRGNRKEMEVARQDMCDALYELFKDELEERERKGKVEGISETIRELIETCAELGATKNETLQRLINKLSLPKESAAKYMNLYWK